MWRYGWFSSHINTGLKLAISKRAEKNFKVSLIKELLIEPKSLTKNIQSKGDH